MKTVAFCSMLVFVFVASGCRKSTTVTAPDGSKVTVVEKGQVTEVTMKNAEGTVRYAGGEGGVALPSDFPKDVPIYPGATVTASVTTGEAVNVVLKAPDSVAQSKTFYREQLPAKGWKLEVSMDAGEGAMFSGKQGNRTLTVSIAPEGGGTMITLIVATE